jgi:hypothetical protein
MSKKPNRDEIPERLLSSEDLLTFIELDGFSDDWRRLGLEDTDLAALQIAIMCAPDKPPVIKGTGGLRKIRFAPKSWGTGKSGGARVCYAYFQQFSTVLLVVAYSKNEQDNISPQHRKAYRSLIERVEKLLETRTYR